MSDSGSQASERPKPSLEGTTRAVVFVVVLAFMVLGPLSRQFLGVETPHLRAWVMFSGIGLGAMDVRFFERHRDGSNTELDPFAALGKKRPANARDRRLKGKRAVWRVVRAICERNDFAIDLRVRGRRATPEGWTQDFDGEANLCPLAAEEIADPSKPARRRRR